MILFTFILVTEGARAVVVSESALLLRVVISARPTLITIYESDGYDFPRRIDGNGMMN